MTDSRTTEEKPRSEVTVSQRRVLIVDDDSDFATSIADVLESRGYEVAVAHSIESGRTVADTFEPALALVDIRLGQESGIDLLEHLRLRHPSILVIMMTAYAGAETAIRALQRGAYDYLRKPLDTQELLLTVSRSVERLQLEESKNNAERELRAREQELLQVQKMESIGRLAGGVAHDLNNLLSPILGYSEMMLLDTGPEDSRHEKIQQIQRAAERARDLTQKLLAFGRKQVLELREVSLQDVITSFLEMLPIREDIEVRCRARDEDGVIRCDVAQLEQILMNLAVNAQDAMPKGGRLTFETRNIVLDEEMVERYPGTELGPHVMLVVSDTGEGMDAVTLDNMFEPFFTTKGKGGTGLGLSTVYGIVKQHRGSIRVYSEPERGTTFKICLPRTDRAANSLRPAPRPRQTRGGDETIVLVEDDDAVRKLVQEMLERSGYTVISSPNGRSGLEDLPPVDLLVTDVVLPDENGPEIHARLSADRPGLPVLYMSGYTDDVIDYHGLLDGQVKLLQKPFAWRELAEKIREILDF